MLTTNPVARRDWLRALRRFKYGLQVRAKLGVVQVVCEQVARQRLTQTQWTAPVWDDDKWVTLLYTCIHDNQHPTELLEAFAQTAEVYFFTYAPQPTVANTLDAANLVCRRLSRRLRERFGVFTCCTRQTGE